MGGKRLQYLSDIARHGLLVEVTCRGCSRVTRFRPEQLRRRARADAEPHQLRFRCAACGARRVRIAPQPTQR